MIYSYIENYDSCGINSEYSKEFGTDVGEIIKKMSKAGELDPILKSYLFAADRQIRTRVYTDNLLARNIDESLKVVQKFLNC